MPKPKLPAPYPLQAFDQANKVGIVLNQQGRYLEYFEETYRLWFVSGMEAGSEANLRLVLKTMTLDYDESCIKPKMKPSSRCTKQILRKLSNWESLVRLHSL